MKAEFTLNAHDTLLSITVTRDETAPLVDGAGAPLKLDVMAASELLPLVKDDKSVLNLLLEAVSVIMAQYDVTIERELHARNGDRWKENSEEKQREAR